MARFGNFKIVVAYYKNKGLMKNSVIHRRNLMCKCMYEFDLNIVVVPNFMSHQYIYKYIYVFFYIYFLLKVDIG